MRKETEHTTRSTSYERPCLVARNISFPSIPWEHIAEQVPYSQKKKSNTTAKGVRH
jgi:hypothetical protein